MKNRFFLFVVSLIVTAGVTGHAGSFPLWLPIGDGMGAECFTIRRDGDLLIHAGRAIFLLRPGEVQPDTLTMIPGSMYVSFNSTALNPRGELFAATERGLWKSTDDGATWQVLDSSRAIESIVVDDNGYIYLPGPDWEGLFSLSRDNGESWQSIGTTRTGSPDITHLAVRGRIVVVGATDGMYYSEDGGQTFAHDLYKDDVFRKEFNSIYDLERHPAGVVFVGIRDIAGPLHTDLDGTWMSDVAGRRYQRIKALQNGYTFAVDSLYNMYAFCFNESPLEHGVFRSADTGRTWTFFNEGRASWAHTVHDMITTPEGYVYTGGAGVFRTVQRMRSGPAFWGRTRLCNAVEYVVMDSSVASVQILPSQSDNVRLEVLSPLGAAKVKIRLSLFDERRAGRYTLRALNAAGMETLYSDTLLKVLPTVEIGQHGDTLWAGGGYVYQWYRNDELMPDERREYLVPTEPGAYSVQVLHANGCEKRSAAFVYVPTSVREAEEPGALLGQNTPNPADGTTFLHFSLSRPGTVRLIINDVTGRILAVAAEGLYQTGEHTVRFDTSRLVPGVYFYRLEAEGTVTGGRMTVLR